MKAMILAAGRGKRMKPLSDTLPKPLLEVHTKPLIVWHVEKLSACGFNEVIINIAYLGHKIPELLGDGSKWNLKITYSNEQEEALESAGGIIKALKFFEDEPFLVVNGDIFTDYNFDYNFNLDNKLAHLILVPNPEHNKNGDFGLDTNLVSNTAHSKYTFSGIGYYNPRLFRGIESTKLALAPLLREAIEKKEISGELYNGNWHDIGTPQRLKDINRIKVK